MFHKGNKFYHNTSLIRAVEYEIILFKYRNVTLLVGQVKRMIIGNHPETHKITLFEPGHLALRFDTQHNYYLFKLYTPT